MSYEIIGETIKSATSLKLGQLFNNPYRYKETITKPKYPNFYINQVNLEISHSGRNRLQLDYLMTIQYRVAENIETITNLHQQLDAVGIRLCSELTELNLQKPTKTKNTYYTKDDGVLNMFFNITVFATPEEEVGPKMEQLELEEEVI